MSWHATVESAIGLYHPTEVVRAKSGRWHVWCESCDGYVSHEYGHGNPETAEIVAARHTKGCSLVTPDETPGPYGPGVTARVTAAANAALAADKARAYRVSRPRVLVSFCGAGGSAMGWHRAGWEVWGVDIFPQSNFPWPERFIEADALEYLFDHGGEFDAHDAGPPCQASTALTKGTNKSRGWGRTHFDLIGDTRTVLEDWGLPYVIENVSGAAVRKDLTLCGEMFGLQVIRHRHFELGGWGMPQPLHVPHRGRVAGYRHGEWFDGPYFAVYGDGGGKGTVQQWQQAMGIPWTDVRKEIAEAIPPAYTEFIGAQLMQHITSAQQEAA